MTVRFHDSLTPLLVPIGQVTPFPDNPRVGDTASIAESIRVNGMYQPVVAQRSTGHVLAGNHRLAALHSLGSDTIPVVWVDVDDDRAARIALVDNRSSDLAEYDTGRLADLLRQLDATQDGLLGSGYDDHALDSILQSATQELHGLERLAELETGNDTKPAKRKLPLDLFFSVSEAVLVAEAMVAYRMGWQAGVITTAATAARRMYKKFPKAARIGFMDNEWHDYDHAQHIAVLKEFAPKYATTRDLLTKEQAAAAGVQWYGLDETLDMAAEVADAGVDNVIVIPKFATVLDKIPETIGGKRVVLGYSVQTSYGGTPVPIKAFAGRPIHLLGGSWKKQRSYLNLMGDDVVSLDNNHLMRIAEWGSCYVPDGRTPKVQEVVGGALTAAGRATYFPAVVLSLAAIVEYVTTQFGLDLAPVPLGDEAADTPAVSGPRDGEEDE